MDSTENKTGTEESTASLFKHLVVNFVAGLLITGAAIAFALIEKWCKAQDLPVYVQLGIQVVSIALFVLDAVLVIGTAAVAVLRLFKKKH